MGRPPTIRATKFCKRCQREFTPRADAKGTYCSRKCRLEQFGEDSRSVERGGKRVLKAHPQSKPHPIHVQEYHAWVNMKTRCYRPKLCPKHWHRYGGRGITVCERWINSFANFLADMGPKPNPKLTLERINNDGNYEPDNCKWATPEEQRKNQSPRPKKTYSVGSEQMTIEQIAGKLGVRSGVVLAWRHRKGYTYEQLLACGIPGKFPAPLREIWPYPDRVERHQLILRWRKLEIPLRVCGALLGMSRQAVEKIEHGEFHEQFPTHANGLRKQYEYGVDTQQRGRPRHKPQPYSALDEDSLLSLGMA